MLLFGHFLKLGSNKVHRIEINNFFFHKHFTRITILSNWTEPGMTQGYGLIIIQVSVIITTLLTIRYNTLYLHYA